MVHRLRKIRTGPNNSFAGPAVTLACDECRVATLGRTREAAVELHDQIAADADRLAASRVDEDFWKENYSR